MIYRLAAAKKIPAFKVGGTWRFSRADIATGSSRSRWKDSTPDATEMIRPRSKRTMGSMRDELLQRCTVRSHDGRHGVGSRRAQTVFSGGRTAKGA
nr:helix-turn-helix domain-containing protein [Ferrovum sp.]